MSDLPPINQKYGVDTTEFKAGLTAMNRELRLLDSAFKASAAELGDWGSSASGLEARIESLSKMIEVQKDRVAATRKEYERLAKEKGANSSAAKEMLIWLNNETAQLNKFENELSQSKEKLAGLEKASDGAADEMNHMERETGGAIQGLEKLKGVAAGLGTALKVGMGAMLGLAGAVVAVGAGVGKLVMSTSDAAGELVDLSQKTGITVERLQELQYVGKQVGTGADSMVDAMARLVRSMSAAREQTEDFQDKAGKAAAEAAKKAAKIEEDYTESAGKVQAKLVKVERENADERAKIEQDLQSDLKKVTADTLKEIQGLEEKHADKMAALQASITGVQSDFEYDSVKRKEDLNRDLTRAEEDYNHDREKLVKELGTAETEDEKARIQEKIDELDYEFNTRKKRREEDADVAQKEAEHAKEQRIKALQEQLSAETAEFEKQKNEINAKQVEQEAAARARYQEELKAAKERYDGEVQAAGEAMDEIATKRNEALQGNKVDAELGDQAKAFEKLGISVVDANGNLKDNQTIFAETIDALGKVQNATERDALAMAIFGKSAQELNPLIKAGREEIARLSDEAHANGAVMSEDVVNDFEKFGDSVAALISGFQGTIGTLAHAFLPFFQGLVDQANTYLGQFSEIVKGSNGDLVTMADGIGKLLGQILTDFAKQGPELLEGGLKIVQGILDAIVANLPMLLDGAVKIITMLVKFLVDNLPTIIDAGVQILLTLVNAIVDNLPMIVDAGVKALLALIDGLTKAIPELIPAITEAILKIDEILIDHLPELVEAGGKLLLAVVQGLSDALPMLIDKTPQLIDALARAFIEMMPIVVQIGWEIIKAIGKGIVESIPHLVEAVKDMPKILSDANAAFWQQWAEIGMNIVSGIWQGIVNRKNQFFEDVKGFFLGMVGASKDALQSHSPSKVYQDLGENAASSFVDSMGSTLEAGRKGPLETMVAMGQGIGQWLTDGLAGSAKMLMETTRSLVEMIRTSLEELAAVGRKIPELIAAGIKDSTPLAIEAIGRLGQGMLEALHAPLSQMRKEMSMTLNQMQDLLQTSALATQMVTQAGSVINNYNNVVYNLTTSSPSGAQASLSQELRYIQMLSGETK